MKSRCRGMVWVLTLFAVMSVPTRAHAAIDAGIQSVQGMVRGAGTDGFYKCDVERTVLTFLELADQALNPSSGTPDKNRAIQYIGMAKECLCKPSREFNYKVTPPALFRSYNTLPDLAAFQHNETAQHAGYDICSALDNLVVMIESGPSMLSWIVVALLALIWVGAGWRFRRPCSSR